MTSYLYHPDSEALMRARSGRRAASRVSAITSKGQATIPADYRRRIGLRPGDLVTLELEGDRIVIRKVQALNHAWNAAQSRLMGEWASAEDAVFDKE